MATAKRIAKNTFFLIASTLVQKALSFLLIIYIARVLGVANFGIYSFVFSFVVMFSVISDLGLSSFIVREIAKDRAQTGKIVGTSFVLKIILSIISLAVIFAFISLLKYDSFVVNLVLLAGISMLLDSIAGLFRSVFFATERMGYDFFVNVVQKLFILLASVYVLLAGHGLLALVMVMVAASMLSLVLSAGIMFFFFARPSIEWNAAFYKKLFFGALPFCMIAFFMSLYSGLDITMLSFFHKGSPSFVAYYSSAMRLINTLGLIAVSFSSAVFPVMTRFFADRNSSVSLLIKKSLNYLLIIILPIAFGTTILAGRIIDLFFGAEFFPAGPALQILIWFCAISFMNVVLMNSLNSINRERDSAIIVALALGLNALLNFFLIPKYNFIGASVATIISGSFHLSMNYFAVSRHFKGISLPEIAAKPVAAGIAMAILVFFMQPFNIWLIMPVAAIFYFAVLVAIRGFSEEDRKILGQILKFDAKPSAAAFTEEKN